MAVQRGSVRLLRRCCVAPGVAVDHDVFDGSGHGYVRAVLGCRGIRGIGIPNANFCQEECVSRVPLARAGGGLDSVCGDAGDGIECDRGLQRLSTGWRRR